MDKIIILGTAHTINTPGKCSPDKKFREYDYSRRVANATKKGLEARGVTVLIDMPEANGSGNQSVELKKRVAYVNNICAKYGAGKCAYISIHVNAAGADGKWHNAAGFCIFTTKGQNNSDKLATCIHEVAQEELKKYSHLVEQGKKTGAYSAKQVGVRADYSDGDPDVEANFYVIRHTACPSVLSENMFQDTKADVEWLLSDEGFNAIVDIHVKGILNWIEKYGTK